jgi:hypothetical protein
MFFFFFCILIFQDTDKAVNPFLATQASPGMGKSSFIDVMTGLSPVQIEEYSPKGATSAFFKAMCGAIHLVVDFNGYQTLNHFDAKHPIAGLAIRLLHTYDSVPDQFCRWKCIESCWFVFVFVFVFCFAFFFFFFSFAVTSPRKRFMKIFFISSLLHLITNPCPRWMLILPSA